MELELGLDPDDAAPASPCAARATEDRQGAQPAIRIVWHDSPDRTLTQQGLALAEQRPGWRLERLHPNA